ncbi:unnamed protein product, partial [Allacma fusca]
IVKLKNAHEKVHAPKHLKCPKCSNKTNSVSNLNRHQRESCEKIQVSLFACPRCGKKYGSAIIGSLIQGRSSHNEAFEIFAIWNLEMVCVRMLENPLKAFYDGS